MLAPYRTTLDKAATAASLLGEGLLAEALHAFDPEADPVEAFWGVGELAFACRKCFEGAAPGHAWAIAALEDAYVLCGDAFAFALASESLSNVAYQCTRRSGLAYSLPPAEVPHAYA